MINVNVFFDAHNLNKYTDYGCSPLFIEQIEDFLNKNADTITELHIALYLFNNMRLYNILDSLAAKGCRVTVYSIPLDGYDNDHRVAIVDGISGQIIGYETKFSLASKVYTTIIKKDRQTFQLRIVPHMYLRSSKVHAFSRGNMPYSLHCKTFFAKTLDSKSYAGITSSNLAVRDSEKHELGIIFPLDQKMETASIDFFQGLMDNSIALSDFDPESDYSHFKIHMRLTPAKSNLMYIAPFYYDSSIFFELNIRKMVENAKNRIIVCAQHISAYNYSYDNAFQDSNPKEGRTIRPGFLAAVLEKAQQGINVIFLSQTYIDSSGSHGCRVPDNKKSFVDFVEKAKTSRCSYYVNEHLHSKFIIIDNIAIITTCNFTPTQFIYLPNVNIPSFDNIPNSSYSGIFCEFGVYFADYNKPLTDALLSFSKWVVKRPETKRMF